MQHASAGSEMFASRNSEEKAVAESYYESLSYADSG